MRLLFLVTFEFRKKVHSDVNGFAPPLCSIAIMKLNPKQSGFQTKLNSCKCLSDIANKYYVYYIIMLCLIIIQADEE